MFVEIQFKDGERNLTPILDESSPNQNLYFFVEEEIDNILLEVEYNNGSPNIISKDEQIVESRNSLNAKLEEIYLQIIENIQSGTESNESINKSTEKPYDPDKIRVDTKSFSLRQIYDMIEYGDLELTPDFQRYFVWDTTRQSKLIESILLRIPLPMFYFSQDEEGKITVVDGLQRLTTIKRFMDNELQLRNLEYLETCENKFYSKEHDIDATNQSSKIDSKYFRWFNMTQIVVNIIDPSSPTGVKYDIFRRINTGGKPLNAQEIRNCLAKPHVREILNSMSNSEEFKSTTLGSIKNTRMEAQEMALRFITFYDLHEKFQEKGKEFLSNYSGNMALTLDLKIEDLNKKTSNELDEYYKLYINAMKIAEYLFGEYAFRKCLTKHLLPNSRKQLINKALFVSWSVILSNFQLEKTKINFKEKSFAKPLAERITSDSNLFNYISFGTNGRVNIEEAFFTAKEIIKSENNAG